MTNAPSMCPIPTTGGADCWREPEPQGFADICTQHMEAVSDAWVRDYPEYAIRCPTCHQLSIWRLRRREVFFCTNEGCRRVAAGEVNVEVLDAMRAENQAEREASERLRQRKLAALAVDSAGVVYYMTFGDRVKIGTSTNLPQRAKVIPHDAVIAVEPGGYSVEAQRHRQFAQHLIPGQREWFHAAPELLWHAEGLREKHGSPMAAWRNSDRGALRG